MPRLPAALLVLLAACAQSLDEDDLTRGACPGNLVANPGFDDGTSGFAANGGTAAPDPDGHTGPGVRVCATSGAESYYNLNDEPDSVPSPALGDRFHLEAWARSDSTHPQPLQAVIRERGADGEFVDQASSTVVLTPTWQRTEVSYAVMTTDARAVEIYFAVSEVEDGDCFVLDDLCLERAPP